MVSFIDGGMGVPVKHQMTCCESLTKIVSRTPEFLLINLSSFNIILKYFIQKSTEKDWIAGLAYIYHLLSCDWIAGLAYIYHLLSSDYTGG